MGQTDIMSANPSTAPHLPAGSAFLGGIRTASTSAFVVVIFGSYISMGAFAHDLGFSATWFALSTILLWAAPAQMIIMSALPTATAPIEIDVRTLYALPQAGCSRLEVTTRQKDVVEKAKRGDKELTYQVSYCRDARFPEKR